MSALSVLPLDIVDKIIDALVLADDPILTSTKACTLTCRDLLPICHARLFASVSLNSPYSKPPFAWSVAGKAVAFARLLGQNPTLGAYVRNLDYASHLEDLKSKNARRINRAMRHITNLRSLIVSNQLMVREFEWDVNPLRPALLHLLHLPALTHLEIKYMPKFLVEDLAPCAGLEVLSCHSLRSYTPKPSPLAEAPSHRPLKIRKLVAKDSASTVQRLCAVTVGADRTPLIDFAYLTDLKIGLDNREDMKAFPLLLRRCTQLVSLDMDLYFQHNKQNLLGLAAHLTPCLPTLTHIRLSCYYSSWWKHTDPFFGLIDELARLSPTPFPLPSSSSIPTLPTSAVSLTLSAPTTPRTQNVIESLAFHFNFHTNTECDRVHIWKRFNAVLASPSAFPALRRVSMQIEMSTMPREYRQRIASGVGLGAALKELPETYLSGLKEREGVIFDFEVIEVTF